MTRASVLDKAGLRQHLRCVRRANTLLLARLIRFVGGKRTGLNSRQDIHPTSSSFSGAFSTPSVLFLDVARAQFKKKHKKTQKW